MKTADKHYRRCVRKKMFEFKRDHAWGWRPPRKLRTIRPWTDAEVNFVWNLRNIAVEAGRKRMVAKGRYQYATPEEINQLTPEQIAKFEARSGRKLK
jgi:hypothetical protein